MAQMRIAIQDNGMVTIFTDDGTFKAGKEMTEKILALLQADGVDFDEIGQTEQHRHEDVGDLVHEIPHVHEWEQ